MTFNDFLKTHKVNGYALCDVNGPHCLSDQEIQLLQDWWNGDQAEHYIKKLLTA